MRRPVQNHPKVSILSEKRLTKFRKPCGRRLSRLLGRAAGKTRPARNKGSRNTNFVAGKRGPSCYLLNFQYIKEIFFERARSRQKTRLCWQQKTNFTGDHAARRLQACVTACPPFLLRPSPDGRRTGDAPGSTTLVWKLLHPDL